MGRTGVWLHMRLPLPSLILAFLLAAPAAAMKTDLRSVAGMMGQQRVLLVFAPTMRDRRLEAQRRAIARFGAGAAARDLVLVQVADGKVIGAHNREERLRRTYDTPTGRYRTLLIGKDGNVALDEPGPISERRLQQVIDAMPMRQKEMRKP